MEPFRFLFGQCWAFVLKTPVSFPEHDLVVFAPLDAHLIFVPQEETAVVHVGEVEASGLRPVHCLCPVRPR